MRFEEMHLAGVSAEEAARIHGAAKIDPIDSRSAQALIERSGRDSGWQKPFWGL
jgi:hypothetical protein